MVWSDDEMVNTFATIKACRQCAEFWSCINGRPWSTRIFKVKSNEQRQRREWKYRQSKTTNEKAALTGFRNLWGL